MDKEFIVNFLNALILANQNELNNQISLQYEHYLHGKLDAYTFIKNYILDT